MTKRGGMERTVYQEVEVPHVFEAYAIKDCWFCREWFALRHKMKVDVGALHRGIGTTKQNET